MSTPPRVALIGCGYWGKNLARNLHALGALAAVCDPTAAGRETATTIAPEAEVMESFEPVLESDSIDAVAIATPAETHYPIAASALRAGKEVFVEKPLALNAAEGAELEQLAIENDRILMVGHLLEHHPAVLRLRELIENGDLGELHYIYSNRLNFGKVRTEENALWSFAPHDVAVILRLFGEMPTEATCTGGNYLSPGLADVTVSSLRFPSGRQAHIFVSWLNPFKEQKLVVLGAQAMAVFNDVAEDKLVLYDQHVDMTPPVPVLHRHGSRPIPFEAAEPLRRECEHFLECITTRQTPRTDAASGVRVLRVLEACQRSLEKQGQPVSLDAN